MSSEDSGLERMSASSQKKLPMKTTPSSKDKLPDEETKFLSSVEATMWKQNYSRENVVFSRLSNLRKLEFQVTGKREKLFEDYTKVLMQETDVLKSFADIQQRKKEMESFLRDFQKELSGFRSQIEEKESELNYARHRVDEALDVVMISFERTCGALKRVKEQQERDRKLLGAETAKRARVQTNLETMEEDLESEKEKVECQICSHSTRDTLILPCMHFVYCNDCLVAHQKKTNTCPACRGTITALLLCKFGIE